MFLKIRIFIYSLYFNIRYLPLRQAIKFPITINPHVKIRALSRGGIVIDSSSLSLGMISFGTRRGSFCLGQKRASIYIEPDCRLVFRGHCSIDMGYAIAINNKGEINIGNNVHINANSIISASSLIKVDDNVGTGWDCTFIDGDGHDIINIERGEVINTPRHIVIGKGCWIGAKSTIMKGAHLCDNTIVPYGSIITKKCEEPYCIFGGMPNRVIKSGVARKDKL